MRSLKWVLGQVRFSFSLVLLSMNQVWSKSKAKQYDAFELNCMWFKITMRKSNKNRQRSEDRKIYLYDVFSAIVYLINNFNINYCWSHHEMEALVKIQSTHRHRFGTIKSNQLKIQLIHLPCLWHIGWQCIDQVRLSYHVIVH